MKYRDLILIACFSSSAPLASGGVVWVDWSTGALQSFANSVGSVGTVSYSHTFQSIVPGSLTSPDAGFPFGDPVKLLNVYQFGNASITFSFNNVSADSGTIFTLGNLRPTNRYFVSAYDNSNAPISLTSWSNLGEYRIYANDTATNLWNPSTGEMVGNGVVSAQTNSKNFFLGLTASTAKVRVDFDNVDNSFEYLDFGLAQSVAEPSTFTLVGLALFGLAHARRRRSSPSRLTKC